MGFQSLSLLNCVQFSVTDPGFPVGGVNLVDSRGGYVSKILYVETKESGPLGIVHRAYPPRSANATANIGVTGSLLCFALYQ